MNNRPMVVQRRATTLRVQLQADNLRMQIVVSDQIATKGTCRRCKDIINSTSIRSSRCKLCKTRLLNLECGSIRNTSNDGNFRRLDAILMTMVVMLLLRLLLLLLLPLWLLLLLVLPLFPLRLLLLLLLLPPNSKPLQIGEDDFRGFSRKAFLLLEECEKSKWAKRLRCWQR